MQESDAVLAVASTSNIQASGYSATESVEAAAVEAASYSISTPCTPAIPSTSAIVSFCTLMPVPHRSRPSSTRAVRKKPPTPELTSDETLKFVSEDY